MNSAPPCAVRSLLLGGSLLTACFDPSTAEGLPCSDDRSCGSEHVCALGYCRAELDDALAHCGDGTSARGEFCYPLSRRIDLPVGDAELRAVAWADLDGDGLDDAVTVSELATVVHINLGGAFNASPLEVQLTPASLASFDLPDPVAELTIPARAVRMTLGDFTGDPLPDVVFSLELPFEIPPEYEPIRDAVEAFLWIADNQGVDASPPLPIPGTDPLGAAELPFNGLLTGDFDGDGHDDVLIVAEQDGASTLRWLPGGPTGPLPPRLLPLEGSSSVVVADIDEDGRDDILVLRRALGVVSRLHGPLQSDVLHQELGASVTAMHVGALDEEPGLDLATLGTDPSIRQLWSWTRDGWSPTAAAEGPPAHTISAGDLDGDGVVDLVAAGPDGLAVHSGFVGPEFGAPFVIVDELAARVDTRHLDDDDVPDLVLRDGQRLVVRLSNP